MSETRSIGIVGARGHTGAELIRLIVAHPALELAFVSSRELDGQPVTEHHSDFAGTLRYENLDPAGAAAKRADVVILALPNGHSGAFVEALEGARRDTLIVDISADHRFDDDWHYGLPELFRDRWRGEKRIANPGCYATAMELAVAPLKGLLAAPPVCFGVSGYSGAGTTPSDKNNPEKLAGNIMPYALTGHGHEKEASFRLGIPVEFMPHVAPHFRGLMVTCNLYLSAAQSLSAVQDRYRDHYGDEPLVQVLADGKMPWISQVGNRHHAQVGGFALAADGRRAVVVATLDNLLKGAATQAMQNINQALGIDEFTAIPMSGEVAA